MLRVGLDLRPTEQGFKAHAGRGTGRYAGELIGHLLESRGRIDEERACELVPFSSKDLQHSPWEAQLLNILPFGKQSVDTQLFLSRHLNSLPVDLVHFFAHGDAPAWGAKPYLATVLDLIPLKFPDLYKAKKADWRFRLARNLENKAITNARGIIAISEATKRDLTEMLGVNPDEIFVTPLAVSSQFRPFDGDSKITRSALRESFGISLNQKALLYVGGIDPRKNIRFMLKVFKESLPYLHGNAVLLLAGNYASDDHFGQLQRDITDFRLNDKVKLLHFVPEERLVELYQAADLFIFPSLYEGFGFPVLESIASGTPVLAGDNSSIPEVLGRSYPLLRDNDLTGWVERLLSILQNNDEREALVEMGLSRSREFSWKRTAKLTLVAYDYFGSQLTRRHAA